MKEIKQTTGEHQKNKRVEKSQEDMSQSKEEALSGTETRLRDRAESISETNRQVCLSVIKGRQGRKKLKETAEA